MCLRGCTGLRDLAAWRKSCSSAMDHESSHIEKLHCTYEEALNISQQWVELERMLADAWHLVARGLPASKSRIEVSSDASSEEQTATPTARAARKILAPADAIVITRWLDAWSRCLDPGSVWSDHRCTWLSTRGLLLRVSSDASKGTESSRERTCKPICIGLLDCADGLEPTPMLDSSMQSATAVAADATSLSDTASNLIDTVRNNRACRATWMPIVVQLFCAPARPADYALTSRYRRCEKRCLG